MKRSILAGVLALISGITNLTAQKQPTPKSQKEVEAINAMIKAQTPDERIKTADTLMTKFADTEFMAIAMQMTAEAYEQKNDFEKMQVWCEKTIEVDPKNYSCMLMIAGGTAKRARENDLDLSEKLSRVDKFAKQALEVLKDAPKPNPGIPDDQWTAAKKDYASQAHEAFALAAMLRKKYDVAIAEFKEAVDGAGTPDPATMVRLGQCYDQAGKPDDAVAILDKVMAMPNIHPQIRQFAQAERVRAIQAKGKSAAPPPTPPAAPAAAPPAGDTKK
jgi:tetratricopeptide (TPR) repeat protein